MGNSCTSKSFEEGEIMIMEPRRLGSKRSITQARQPTKISGNCVVNVPMEPMGDMPSAKMVAVETNPMTPVVSYRMAPSLKVAQTLLSSTIANFEAALASAPGDLRREPLVDGLEAFAWTLNRLGGDMGNHLYANTNKLRWSRTRNHSESYKGFLLGELHVHGATGYNHYVDDSAWMGNLWIARLLEFFVELFAELDDGHATRHAGWAAYSRSLEHHHDWFQKWLFSMALDKFPKREEFYNKLRGEGTIADVERDVARLVEVGRPIVQLMFEMKELVNDTMREKRGHR